MSLREEGGGTDILGMLGDADGLDFSTHTVYIHAYLVSGEEKQGLGGRMEKIGIRLD